METLGKPSFRHALGVAIAGAAAGAVIAIGALPVAADHESSSRCSDAAPVPNPFVKLLGHDTAFDADCLAVPADRALRIYLKNEDRDLAHNVSIYLADGPEPKAVEAKATGGKDGQAGKEPDTGAKAKPKPLFKDETFKGPAQEEYAVDALPAGDYRFQCDTHPEDMDGRLVVLKKK